ncbi:MAG: hypothetical protein PF480_14165 [Roseovarius sp.]|jgi:hypothetical protein|nr:hypothetical protein [Roseovarius sp.]
MIETVLRACLHRGFAKFGRENVYDTSYMQEVVAHWPAAGLRYMALPALSRMVGPEPEIWAGAILASTLEGDCGSCAQLVCNEAVEMGVSAAMIAACLRRDFNAAGPVGLGFRFAEAAIAGRPEVDALRHEIRDAFGEQAAIAAAFAAASGRVYPVLKRGLGHGAACQKIVLCGSDHSIAREST